MAVAHISPRSALFYQATGGFLVGLYALWSVGFKPDVHLPSIAFTMFAGAAASIGSLLLLQLLQTETASIAVGATALYPVVTIGLAMLVLGETVSLKQGLGILASLVGLVLMVG